MAATAFYAGFAGPGPEYGRRLARPECWGAGEAGPASEEWVIHLNYPVDDPRAKSDAQVEADARQALGVPDPPMKIHKITR